MARGRLSERSGGGETAPRLRDSRRLLWAGLCGRSNRWGVDRRNPRKTKVNLWMWSWGRCSCFSLKYIRRFLKVTTMSTVLEVPGRIEMGFMDVWGAHETFLFGFHELKLIYFMFFQDIYDVTYCVWSHMSCGQLINVKADQWLISLNL